MWRVFSHNLIRTNLKEVETQLLRQGGHVLTMRVFLVVDRYITIWSSLSNARDPASRFILRRPLGERLNPNRRRNLLYITQKPRPFRYLDVQLLHFVARLTPYHRDAAIHPAEPSVVHPFFRAPRTPRARPALHTHHEAHACLVVASVSSLRHAVSEGTPISSQGR